MHSFRTELHLNPSSHSIHLKDKILTIGSCFSDDIGRRLDDSKFNVSVNPIGTIYNPLSIHKALTYFVDSGKPEKSLYTNHQGIWNHFDFHSQWGQIDREVLERILQTQIEHLHYALKEASTIIITYGTAWVYALKKSNQVVANCHKVPQKEFTKVLLTVDQISKSFESTLDKLKSINPSIRIIITVSPVRHTKDSIELNSASKSVLRMAAHHISTNHPQVEYFPSYEIMLDDLRDYRFYKKDLIHPNETAIDYIWAKFCQCYLAAPTQQIIDQWSELKRAIQHKPFQVQSEAHQAFLKTTLAKLKELQSEIDLTEEIQIVQSQIIK